MKTTVAFLLMFLLLRLTGVAQNLVSGTVLDNKGNPIHGANVFIDGTYDGTTTLEDGSFSFLSSATGTNTIIVSFMSYRIFKKEVDLSEYKELNVVLREDVNSLDAVIISAGTFEAGEKSRVSVLNPLDIVTTAGSAGDIVAALQTLPGTQNVGESGRLFVRGGEAGETQTFVDGLRVAQPYGATVQNVPSRGRFSPFLFSGIAFSTGGYSAEYGEALSSVLILNTEDLAPETKTEISLMTVGLGLGHTQKFNRSSFSINTSYINLKPYQLLIPQNLHWNKAPESLTGEAIYRKELKSGIWKLYAAFDASGFDIDQEDINSPELLRIDLKNNNFYFNSSYRGIFGSNWQVFSGVSYGYSTNNIKLGSKLLKNTEYTSHIKGKLERRIIPGLRVSLGVDYFSLQFDEDFTESPENNFSNGYVSNIGAVYSEAGILFSKNFAMKIGLRASYNDMLQEESFSPRISMAYKTSKTSQISMAYGDFNQSPGSDYLKFSENFSSEKASHYILNFQYNKNRKLFRAEAYYKDYSHLIKYDTPQVQFNSLFNNSGTGYAKGLDIFWRDGKTLKNMEYWVSYSYIDTKRNYRNFPEQVTPNFVANHSASLVTKYWIRDLRSQLGFSYTYSSGRPYNDLNQQEFMAGKTKDFNNLSLSWAYLVSQQKILYLSVSNVLGTDNVFGYEYSKKPDETGIYNRRAIIPTADRFFFIGFFWTISSDKKNNQLETL
jgi:outer membrane cobalamin receptor